MAIACKKTVGTGARTIVLMEEERCFGYVNAKVSNLQTYLGTLKRIEVVTESMINEISSLQSNALNPERAVRRRRRGTSAVSGDLNAELANNGFAYMIVQAIGKLKGAGSAADPYTILPVDVNGVASDETAGYLQDSALYTDQEIHYDSSASDVASDSAGFESGYYTIEEYALEPGMTLLISRDGGTIKNESGENPTNQMWFRYTGNRVNTWNVSSTPGEIVTTTFGMLGRREETVDMATPSYTSRPAVNDPFTGAEGIVTIDDLSVCLLNFDMTVNNNLSTDKYCMGQYYRNSLPEGQRVIEGTISIEFTSLEFYSKYINETSARVELTFDLLGTGTETMKIILPKILFNGTTPTAGGQEAMVQELPYLAVWDDTAATHLVQSGYASNGFDLAVEIVTAGTLV